jgi:transposase-like protein
MNYPTAVKARMIKKLTGPAAISANALAKESGICQGTLSRCVREAATVGQPMSKPEDLVVGLQAPAGGLELGRERSWLPGSGARAGVEAV